jgi:hypothetical protein
MLSTSAACWLTRSERSSVSLKEQPKKSNSEQHSKPKMLKGKSQP